MKREDFLNELMGRMDDDLVQDSAVIKRSKELRRKIIWSVVIMVAVLGYFTFLEAWQWNDFFKNTVDAKAGVIQDDAYYFYRTRSDQEGICRYVPQQGVTLLVPAKERNVDALFQQWGVNSRGLYYTDGQTLWHMDPDTREETVLYALPSQEQEEERGRFQSFQAFREEMEREKNEIDPYLFLAYMGEDSVTLRYYGATDAENATLTLDVATGEITWGARTWGASSNQFLPAHGDSLPSEEDGGRYLAVEKDWAFYASQDTREGSWRQDLWVINIHTGERRLVKEDFSLEWAVTDGTWLYNRPQNRWTCWRILWEDGVPQDVVLVEEVP